MSSRLVHGLPVVWTAAAVLLAAPAGALHAQDDALPTLLSAAGTYLTQYTRAIGGVVAEEDYSQQVRIRGLTSRRLKSDLLIMADPTLGWIEFRDVYEVDGKPVRDRTDRLAKLFQNPSTNAIEQARRIVAEGARFNLDAEGLILDRTINLPLAALMFLRTSNQHRSEFAIDGHGKVEDQETTIVRFKETAMPRMIGSANDAAASGRFWIEPDSGRILRTELLFATQKSAAVAKATIRVDYQEEAKLNQWMPHAMHEHYDVTNRGDIAGVVEGQATYRDFRQFNVQVDEGAQQGPTSPPDGTSPDPQRP